MKKPMTQKEKEQAESILDELRDMYHDVSPDDDYIDEDEGLQEEIQMIDLLLEDPTKDIVDKIERLVQFNSEWFPDGLPASEQEEYRNVLQQAETFLPKP